MHVKEVISMEKQMSDCEKYAHIGSNYDPKNKEEKTIWCIKFLCNQFPTLFLRNPNLDIDAVPIDFFALDITKKYRGMTIFSHTLDAGYYNQCIRFIDQMKYHPDFLTALDFDENLTKQALHHLFDKREEEKTPVFKRDMSRPMLRRKMMHVLSAKYVAEKMMNLTGETNFSGALKLGELREAYRILMREEQARSTQEALLSQINVKDTATLTLLKQITDPHSKNLHHRLLTAKLQQLLTPQNFIEQIRGKKQDYRSRWELGRDEQRRENARQNTEDEIRLPEKKSKISQIPDTVQISQGGNNTGFQPDSQDALFLWAANQGRNK